MFHGWQYQGKASPVLFPEDFPSTVEWFIQPSEPIWELPRPPGEGRGSSQEITEPVVFTTTALDWLVQHPGPRIDPVLVAEGLSVFGDGVVVVVKYDWIVQHPEPLPIQRPVDEGDQRSIVEPTSFVLQKLDWFVQSFNPPVGLEPLVGEGLWSGVLDSTLYTAVVIDWLVQHPEPLPDVELVREGDRFAITEPTAMAVFLPIDWFVQHPERVDGSIPIVAEGDRFSVVEPTMFVVPLYGWIVQHPEPLPIAWPVQEGISLPPFTPIIPIAGTWTSYGSPFLYESANWAHMAFYFEVYMRATAGIVRARLYDVTSASAVGDSDRVTTSSSFVRTRTTSSLSLVDGHEYVSQFSHDSGGQGDFLGAYLIAIGA